MDGAWCKSKSNS